MGQPRLHIMAGQPHMPNKLDVNRLEQMETALRAIVRDHGYRIDKFELVVDLGGARNAPEWPGVTLELTQLPLVPTTFPERAEAYDEPPSFSERGAA